MTSYLYEHLEVRPEELAGFLHWSIGYGDVSIAYFVYESDAIIALEAIKKHDGHDHDEQLNDKL